MGKVSLIINACKSTAVLVKYLKAKNIINKYSM